MEEINKIIKELWQKTYRGTGGALLWHVGLYAVVHGAWQTLTSLRYHQRLTTLPTRPRLGSAPTTIGYENGG